jgi:hypothetical protein
VPSPQNDELISNRRDIGGCDRADPPLVITLIYEGDRVQHQVRGDMLVALLTQDAAILFELPPPLTTIILMLFGLHPSTLQIGRRLSDPPQVTDGATVLVFRVPLSVPSHSTPRGMPPVPFGGAYPGVHFGAQQVHTVVPPLPQHSKFLGNFKLPKFDGSSRH